jgi:hypothetical protein
MYFMSSSLSFCGLGFYIALHLRAQFSSTDEEEPS